MIERDASLALAEMLGGLKRQNPVYYQSLVKVLQACVDPEHLLLVNAPADSIMRQQGRVSFGMDLMQIVAHAEGITMQGAQRTGAQPPTAKDTWHG